MRLGWNAVVVAGWLLLVGTGVSEGAPEGQPGAPGLWELAKSKQAVHRFSTFFATQNVRDHLAIDKGIDTAIAWCRETAPRARLRGHVGLAPRTEKGTGRKRDVTGIRAR